MRGPHPDLLTIVVHAAAAIRRKQSTLEALAEHREMDDAASLERAIGDASQAVVSLFLAAEAAERYCEDHNEPGPLGRRKLGALVMEARRMRDVVLHWDDKGKREPDTSLYIDGRGVVVNAPPGRSVKAAVMDGFTWKEIERLSSSLLRWAQFMREPETDSDT